jgi:hypothetical protein
MLASTRSETPVPGRSQRRPYRHLLSVSDAKRSLADRDGARRNCELAETLSRVPVIPAARKISPRPSSSPMFPNVPELLTFSSLSTPGQRLSRKARYINKLPKSINRAFHTFISESGKFNQRNARYERNQSFEV